MFTRKKVATLVALVAIVGMIASCAPPTPKVVEKEVTKVVEKEVEVVVTATPAVPTYKFPAEGQPYAGTTLNVAMVAEPKPEMLKSLVAEFEAQTGIKVNFDTLAYPTLQEKQFTALTQGTGAYDIVHIDCVWVGQYAGQGWLTPIEDFIEQTDPAVLDIEDFVPALVDEMDMWDGKMYGLPFDTCVMMFYYRTDLFDKYDLSVPQTWDEVYEYAKIINEGEKEEGIYGLTLMAKRGVQLLCTHGNLLGAYGTYYYDEDYRATLDTPEALESVNMLNKLVSVSNPGALAQDYDEGDAFFADGRAAMFVQWNDSIPAYHDPERSKIVGNWAVTLMPGVKQPDGSIRRSPVIGGWNMGIVSDSKNKDAAWEFMLWAVSKDMERRLAAAQPPARHSVLSDPDVVAQYPEYDPMLKSLEIAWGRPRIIVWPHMGDNTEAALSQAVTGELAPEEALKRVNATLNEILKEGGYQK